MARCVVVGGNGFLGSYIVDDLVSRGHEVTVFDRFSSGRPSYSALGVRQVIGDFLNIADLRRALTGQELLFHFLSTTTPATTEDEPSLDLRTNVSQSVELFGIAVEEGISRVYFASTGGAIYGNTGAASIAEDILPAPLSPYAIGKQAIEGYLRYFHRKHGLDSVSFRISNPYGPRQHPNRKQGVIPIFLHRIADGLPVELYGDGLMVRDYIYASDAARMIVDTVGQPAVHPIYNIGSGHGTTITEVVELAREVTGEQVAITYLPQPPTFVDRVVLDISRYQQEFGAGSFIDLRDGMELTWKDTLAQLRNDGARS